MSSKFVAISKIYDVRVHQSLWWLFVGVQALKSVAEAIGP